MQEASENKEASNPIQAKMRIVVALGERMDALAKDPNWKGIDEMNDPRSPFNLENLKVALTNQPREFCYQFDANGQLVSWAKGTKGRVRTYSLPGMMKGGVDVHNHPSEEGRPFGWTFSGADFVSYNNSGVAVGIVHSREGEYRLDLPEAFSKKSRAEVERLASDFDYRFNAIQSGAQVILNKAILDGVKQKDFISMKSMLTAVSRVAGQLMLAETEKMAATMGIKFTFTPNKGYEGWKPLASDADEKTKQAVFKDSVASPPPEFKIASGRKPPHLTTFKEPPIRIGGGFTIVGATDVRQPRKKREPKQAEPTQTTSPNKYYNL